MPDQHARDEQAVLIHAKRSRLAVHLPDRGGGELRIVGGCAVPLRKRRVAVFVVRQVDLDKPFKAFERLDALIARGVPHHRDTEREPLERLAHGAQIVRGRDEIDAVRALVAQTQHHGAQCFHAYGAPLAAAAADRAVLTVHAAQAAAGEKDRSGAPRSADAGLLAEVRRGPRDARQGGGGADASGLCIASLCPAAARAIAANIIHLFPLFRKWSKCLQIGGFTAIIIGFVWLYCKKM